VLGTDENRKRSSIMAITLKQFVTTKNECASLSTLKEGILAAAREAEEAGRHDDLCIDIEGGWHYLDTPITLSAKENPELLSVDLTLRAKYSGRSYIQSLVRLDGNRFVRAEGAPYFTYQMDKDENGDWLMVYHSRDEVCFSGKCGYSDGDSLYDPCRSAHIRKVTPQRGKLLIE
jgi:hypothetical protein